MSLALLTSVVLLATGEPTGVVQQFHAALEAGNTEAALSYLEPYATVGSFGDFYGSREDYAARGLAAHMKLARAWVWTRSYERALHTGKSGWVINQYELTGPATSHLVETANVVEQDGRWRIAHLHWSLRSRSEPVQRVEPPPPPPPQPSQPPGMGRHCIRETASCWQCADITFPAEVSCPESFACDGVCVIQGGRPRCFAGRSYCCDEGESCEKPPGCGAASSCGDREGDGHMDQCTFLSRCGKEPPKRKKGPCAPPPDPDRYRQYGASPPNAVCPPTPLAFHISAEEMARGASDDSGPGICYGVVAFDASGRSTRQSCGTFHCQTLRYCDGREREKYCTILAECRDGVPAATGFTW